jgi:hypothetical protein
MKLYALVTEQMRVVAARNHDKTLTLQNKMCKAYVGVVDYIEPIIMYTHDIKESILYTEESLPKAVKHLRKYKIDFTICPIKKIGHSYKFEN